MEGTATPCMGAMRGPGQVVYQGQGLKDQDKLVQGGSFPKLSMRDSTATP